MSDLSRGATRPGASRAACAAAGLLAALPTLGAGAPRPLAAQPPTHQPPPATPAPARSSDLHPRGTIRGVVRDTAGRPMAAARVRIAELHRESITHEDGSFAFANVPVGRFTVVVLRLGFTGNARTVTVSRDDAATLDVRLVPSPVQQLTAVVTTGTVGERSRDDVLSPVTVLGEAALDRRLDGTVAQTLAGVPGVAVTSMGPAVSRPVIRGLSGDRILVLEDGQRPGDLSSTSGDHAVAVDPLTARQLEVVRGPMSLLYGSSALGGVINVVREEIPTTTPEHAHGTVSAQGATASPGGTVGGTWTNRVGPLAVRAEGSARQAGDLRTPLGTLGNTQVATYGAAVGAAWTGTDGHVGGSFRHYHNAYGLPGGFVGTHPGGVDIEMRRNTGRVEAELHDHTGPFESVRLTGTFTDYAHAERERSGELGTGFAQRFGTGEVIARHDRLGPFATGAVGARVQFRGISTSGSLRTPSTEDASVAGFVVEEVALGSVRVQGGLRYDFARYRPLRRTLVNVGDVPVPTLPRTFGAFSGSLGALWTPRAGVQLGGSVSRAYRTPDFNELYSDGPHLAAYSYDVGNPRLGEETGVGLDVFARLQRGPVRAEVAAFRNAMSGYVFPRNTGEVGRVDGRPKFQFTGVDATLAGVEGEVEWRLARRVVAEGSASYVVGRRRGALDSLPANELFPARLASPWLPFIPPANGRLGVRWDQPRWFAGAATRLAAPQRRLGDFETPTAGYALADLTAGVRFLVGSRLHALTFRLDNLLDTEYRDHLARTRVIMPEAGRNASLLYRVQF